MDVQITNENLNEIRQKEDIMIFAIQTVSWKKVKLLCRICFLKIDTHTSFAKVKKSETKKQNQDN